MSRKFVVDNAVTLEERASLPTAPNTKWRPHFIRLAREYSRAGITSNAQIARLLGFSPRTIALWRETYPAFDAAIENGTNEFIVECTSCVLEAIRQGDSRLALDSLKLRGDAWKPKTSLDHTSNGETLSALLAQHGAMSDKEAIDKGLIIEEGSPLRDNLYEAEESESPRRSREYEDD